MTRIAAAENLTIEYTPDRWRLSLNGDMQERTIVEAAQGGSLRYIGGFADRRRLPVGSLPDNQIKQVVLGWSNSDQSWHLGLLLIPELAEQRGSRWCELARWDDPDASTYAAAAEHAGRGLAQILNRPFRLIPPLVTAEEAAAVRQLPALPLKSGIWKLQRSGEQLELVRAPGWMTWRVLRTVWYAFWMVVYIVLSVATLTVKLALPNSGTLLPNPHILPYLGLAAAAVLFLIVLKNIYDILTQPGRFVIDPTAHTVTALNGATKRWQLATDQISAVYISQVVGRSRNKRTIYHGEINLQTGDRQFKRLIVQDREEERVEKAADKAADKAGKEPALRNEVMPLTVAEVDTDLQAMAMHIAGTLGDLTCLYDQRPQ